MPSTESGIGGFTGLGHGGAEYVPPPPVTKGMDLITQGSTVVVPQEMLLFT